MQYYLTFIFKEKLLWSINQNLILLQNIIQNIITKLRYFAQSVITKIKELII